MTSLSPPQCATPVLASDGHRIHLEEALTARFGLAWEARDDGHSYEIKGLRAANRSPRRCAPARRYGRAPSQRELAQLAQASNFATAQGQERYPGNPPDDRSRCRLRHSLDAQHQQQKSGGPKTAADLHLLGGAKGI